MTKRKIPATTGKTDTPPKDVLQIDAQTGKSEARGLAEVAFDPAAHAMSTARLFNAGSFGSNIGITESFEVLRDVNKTVAAGDLSHHRALLSGQAVALNSVFTELSRRAALNMGDFLGATETYMRLALKAQAQSRATIEALDRLANGREQTVRHVHVDNRGGQAVIAETVHTGGQQNGKIADQSHGTATGAAGVGSALPSPDPLGIGVPIPGSERQAAV